MTRKFAPHREFLRAYDARILNHPTNVCPVLEERRVLDGVTTLLSVGPGAGAIECSIAQQRRLVLSCVEPSAVMREELLRTLDRFGIGELVDAVFETKLEELKATGGYDLVLSLDSWYHIGFNEQALRLALDLRAPGGALLVQLLSRTEQIYWELDCVRGLVSADELSRWAAGLGQRHEYFERTHEVPVSLLIEGGQATEVYRHFVSFATGAPWSAMTQEERDDAVAAVRRLERGGSIRTTYGYLWFRSASKNHSRD